MKSKKIELTNTTIIISCDSQQTYFRPKMHQIAFVAGALPRIPLRELTALSQIP